MIWKLVVMIWTLLIAFQIKHFLADYPLQGRYMLGKFKDKGWVLPLSAHCGVHFIFTFLIAWITLYEDRYQTFLQSLTTPALLALLDFSIHFVMDRIKASPSMLGRYQAITKQDVVEYNDNLNQMTWELKNLRHESDNEMDDYQRARELSSEIIDQENRIDDLKKEFKVKFKSNVLFWWSLGLDQMVHHLTHYLVIYLIIYKMLRNL